MKMRERPAHDENVFIAAANANFSNLRVMWYNHESRFWVQSYHHVEIVAKSVC
jgi:hypothetical protein